MKPLDYFHIHKYFEQTENFLNSVQGFYKLLPPNLHFLKNRILDKVMAYSLLTYYFVMKQIRKSYI